MVLLNGDMKTIEVQAATTITAAETALMTALHVGMYKSMTVFVDYTNGDETSYDIIPKVLRISGGDEHPLCSWSSSGGTKTVTADKFQMTASGKHYVVLNLAGIEWIRLYGDATGGTPSGTAQIGYTLDPK